MNVGLGQEHWPRKVEEVRGLVSVAGGIYGRRLVKGRARCMV